MRLDSRRLAARLRAEQDGGPATVRKTVSGGAACRAVLPWDRRDCPNLADGPDGFCELCRAELAELDAWSEARNEGRIE